MTTAVISLPNEGDIVFFHNLISSRLVVAGEKLRGNLGIGDSLMGYEKSAIHPTGYGFLFLVLGVWVKNLLHFPLTYSFATRLNTCIKVCLSYKITEIYYQMCGCIEDI